MIDEIFSYATPHNLSDLLGQAVRLQGSARCRVRILCNKVIATELPDNPGMSITNAAASIAMQVCQYYEIPLDRLIWIEHYPKEPNHEETYDLVHFISVDGFLSMDRWQRLSINEAEQFFGERLR